MTIDGARGILFNITGGHDLSLFEVNEAATLIRAAAHPDCRVIFGAVIDPNMKDQMRITVIATGFDQQTAIPRRVIRQTSGTTQRRTCAALFIHLQHNASATSKGRRSGAPGATRPR